MHCTMQRLVKMVKRVKTMCKKLSVVFKLKSPLHIGYTPFKGSVVSPTRYYVLGKNFWGAITKRITEFLKNNSQGDNSQKYNYKNIGLEVMENFKFSNFYLYDGKTVYTPSYTDDGLKYGGIPQTEFEHMFIGSRISTGINEKSQIAKDESLHEIEFINNKFRDEKGNIKDVKIAGNIWVKDSAKIFEYAVQQDTNSITINNFNIIQELILGGESKYGFGHVEIDSIGRNIPLEINSSESGEQVTVTIEDKEPLLLHLEYLDEIQFKGDIERLTGRVYYDPENEKNNASKDSNNAPGKNISKVKTFLTPGTRVTGKQEYKAELNYDGTLININEKK